MGCLMTTSKRKAARDNNLYTQYITQASMPNNSTPLSPKQIKAIKSLTKEQIVQILFHKEIGGN